MCGLRFSCCQTSLFRISRVCLGSSSVGQTDGFIVAGSLALPCPRTDFSPCSRHRVSLGSHSSGPAAGAGLLRRLSVGGVAWEGAE